MVRSFRCSVACGILGTQPGIEPTSPALQGRPRCSFCWLSIATFPKWAIFCYPFLFSLKGSKEGRKRGERRREMGRKEKRFCKQISENHKTEPCVLELVGCWGDAVQCSLPCRHCVSTISSHPKAVTLWSHLVVTSHCLFKVKCGTWTTCWVASEISIKIGDKRPHSSLLLPFKDLGLEVHTS